MTTRQATIAGFVLVLAIGFIADALARHGRLAVPTFGHALEMVRSRPIGRVILLVVWFWLGWHFIAR
jgi:hypothetical protein